MSGQDLDMHLHSTSLALHFSYLKKKTKNNTTHNEIPFRMVSQVSQVPGTNKFLKHIQKATLLKMWND